MALDETTPFRWQEGIDAGIPRRALAGAGYRCVVAGVYIKAEVSLTPYLEARAALLVGGKDSFVSHHTAARLWGGIVPDGPSLHAAVAPGRSRSSHREVVVHQSGRRPTTFRGVRVTTASDTFLDLALHLPLVDLVILGDSLVRKGRITPELLVEAMDEATSRGKRLARRAAALVRKGVDSPMETRARMLRVLSGLPELETDIRFYEDDDPNGRLLRRLDSGDRETRTAVEYDGRQHIEREAAWEADLGRREEFEDEEWRIVTLVSKDIFKTPDRSVLRMARIFRARGMKIGPLSDEWRRHFPVRESSAAA